MSDYLTIKNNGSAEIVIKKSRFVATFQRVANEEEAQDFIKAVKKEHHTATHNCSAYTIGLNDEIQRAHDDGEPSGTAGVPMLEALKKMKLKNIAVVVTRYFGGIKLGAGGLIRAYSNAVSNGAKEIGVVLRVLQPQLSFDIPYDKLGPVEYYLEQNNIFVANKDFGASVLITIFLDDEAISVFQEGLAQILNQIPDITVGEARYNEIEQAIE